MAVVERTDTIIMYNFFDSLFHYVHHSGVESRQFYHDKKSVLHPTAFLTI